MSTPHVGVQPAGRTSRGPINRCYAINHQSYEGEGPWLLLPHHSTIFHLLLRDDAKWAMGPQRRPITMRDTPDLLSNDSPKGLSIIIQLHKHARARSSTESRHKALQNNLRWNKQCLSHFHGHFVHIEACELRVHPYRTLRANN